jgi:thiamine pyrophosphate-dependent acetolactate synthase large subunit-like protein
MDGKEWYVNGKNPFGNRFSNSYMKNGMPNFARVARAYGIEGWEVKTLKIYITLWKTIKI